jgi:hypothetical protein
MSVNYYFFVAGRLKTHFSLNTHCFAVHYCVCCVCVVSINEAIERFILFNGLNGLFGLIRLNSNEQSHVIEIEIASWVHVLIVCNKNDDSICQDWRGYSETSSLSLLCLHAYKISSVPRENIPNISLETKIFKIFT